MFPKTSYSLIEALQRGDAVSHKRALDVLAAAYWKPVYKYLRLHWHESGDNAQDITQAFFASVVERDVFDGYEPSRAAFRTFLRTCLDRFVMNQRKAETRIKRGGHAQMLDLDFPSAELELARAGAATPNGEDYFHTEFVRSLFGMAVDRLRVECAGAGRPIDFELFAAYDLDDNDSAPGYAELAVRHGISETAVTNRLAAARRRFRALTLEVLREITASDAEFRMEARDILGLDVR